MRGKIFIPFILIPLVELGILIKIGGIIGAFNTVILVVITGIIGATMAQSQGFMIMRQIRLELESGRMPGRSLLNGLFVLIGGIVLLTPGILTDILGFALLVPQVRELAIEKLMKKLSERPLGRNSSYYTS